MKELFYQPYDAVITCEVGQIYKDNPTRENHDLLLRQLAPLVTIVSKQLPRSTGVDDDFRRSDAFADLYRVTVNCNFPTSSPKVFTFFFFTTVKRSLINSFYRDKSRAFDFEGACVDPLPQRFKTYEDVDRRLHAVQLRRLILEVVLEEIRFTGREAKACEFITRCILGYINKDPKTVKGRFRISQDKSDKLINYVKVKIKSVTYYLRELDS